MMIARCAGAIAGARSCGEFYAATVRKLLLATLAYAAPRSLGAQMAPNNQLRALAREAIVMDFITFTLAFVVLDHGAIVARGTRSFITQESCIATRATAPGHLTNGMEIRTGQCTLTVRHET